MEAKRREVLATAIVLTDKSSPDTLPEWDSFAHLNVGAALEKESFTLEEVIEMQSLPNIHAVITRKL